MPEEGFGEEDYEGWMWLLVLGDRMGWKRMLTFSELAVHLPAEDVEKVGWGGHVGDLHVAVLVLAV